MPIKKANHQYTLAKTIPSPYAIMPYDSASKGDGVYSGVAYKSAGDWYFNVTIFRIKEWDAFCAGRVLSRLCSRTEQHYVGWGNSCYVPLVRGDATLKNMGHLIKLIDADKHGDVPFLVLNKFFAKNSVPHSVANAYIRNSTYSNIVANAYDDACFIMAGDTVDDGGITEILEGRNTASVGGGVIKTRLVTSKALQNPNTMADCRTYTIELPESGAHKQVVYPEDMTEWYRAKNAIERAKYKLEFNHGDSLMLTTERSW